MKYLRYTLWPLVKVRCRYLWWTVRYGGKKHIPSELVLNEMQKSMQALARNMEQAFRAMPPDMSQNEKGEVVDIMGLAQKLQEEMKRLESEKKG